MRVLLVSERSGGHIFPALAFGKRLSGPQKKNEVYFFTSSKSLRQYIETEGFKVVGRSFNSRIFLLTSLWRFFEAIYLIFELRPEKVIGFGGRDSLFLVLFSCFLNKDVSLYEPNLKLGRANKFLSLFVGKVLRGFQTPNNNRRNKTIGIPLRKNIRKLDKAQARKILNFDQKPVVLCFGGSQGSKFINDIFTKSIRKLQEDFQIIHLTGKDNYQQVLQLYGKIKIPKFVKDFYYQMEVLYSASDLVISRAGAVTLGELSYYRLPSILIPHPYASGHQKENSLYFKNKGAALVQFQSNFSLSEFQNSLKKLISDNSFRQNMANNLARISLGVEFEDFCQNANF
jgi:UDP-N-acetylglucosamine--N-acetylmuramyl-(pentapeptide) pyrophosphoryl-undecaprenol N-acetylglucosamine transferase